jgi:hypothetical protein
MEALKFIFSSFWIWLGFMVLITTSLIIIIKFLYVLIFNMYQRTLRHFVMLKHGYPPKCDADGDLHDIDVDD